MGRSGCCSKVGLRRGPWSAKEDSLLASFIQQNGQGQWRSLPKKAGLLRCGKSCRLRWMNYLRPGIKRGNITQDEEDLIVRLHALLGNRWSLIAGRLQGRTDNEIKNYWNTHLLKKLNLNLLANNTTTTTTTTTTNKFNKNKTKLYFPKPIRLSPTQSYDHTLLTASSSTTELPEPEMLMVSAWPPIPMEDMAPLYPYSDSVSDADEVNMWVKVYAEYMQLL